ncbi:bacillithiol biosynthesis cysteine-adding enzyme BshC [Robertmurraya sp. DFI.2.37]|uniref:bacillithiol biosynthesis cysteine-adding enzyme BshC n=1 Tax=Robertmurraya sp. DFI.2.37 TaxID=3031819 RepID=UPI001247AC79|nr:bacillithiol biosynthesis cysteine-adding enzyme BshC [Robertmurraya sp. DFI.2.37]MDF1506689.1 bacillithiol biosynthesis cysteine-adding enzyme BshC [Robertmurraya sp. DFI.2.37]
MEMMNLNLPATNRFATAYYNGTDEVQNFFHYQYQNSFHYQKRLEELSERSFMREELAAHIEFFMKPFPSSERVFESIAKLKKKDSVVVIGGQQAGILTGPLYSIHKVISIIAFAKQKEKELGVPVVPLFWIAGEDHDYAEVNHVYLENRNQLEKWVYPNKVLDKRMVTDCVLNKEVCQSWIEDVIETFGETEHTNQLLEFSKKAVECSETFVDFFAYIVMELFKEQGLLLVDSGNRQLRQLEKKAFAEQINHAANITASVENQQAKLAEYGFARTIELSSEAANLFYYDEEHFERVLLEFNKETKTFFGKDGNISFSQEELLAIANEQPEKLSNNVVTRPIMQEVLFPTLAFIAGPGEISYWAELKNAFEIFNMKMPPIIPRITITFLEREIESSIADWGLNLQEVLRAGVSEEKERFLTSVKDTSFAELFSEAKEQLMKSYTKIRKQSEKDYKGLIPLLQKNESILLQQIAFMEGKIEEALLIKHDVALKQLDCIDYSIRPFGGPQERVWNIYYFLNKYGLDFVERLLKLPFDFDGTHKVVKI